MQALLKKTITCCVEAGSTVGLGSQIGCHAPTKVKVRVKETTSASSFQCRFGFLVRRSCLDCGLGMFSDWTAGISATRNEKLSHFVV